MMLVEDPHRRVCYRTPKGNPPTTVFDPINTRPDSGLSRAIHIPDLGAALNQLLC
jgi:hypothetical protein